MAKTVKKDLKAILASAVALVADLTALAGASAPAEAAAEPKSVPTIKELKALDDAGVLEAATELGIKVKKAATARALLTTAALVVAEKPIDDDDDLTTLANAIGLDVEEKDADETTEALKEYFSGGAAEAPTEEETPEEEEDETPAPKAKGKKHVVADDEDDENAAAGEEELSDEDKLKAYNAVFKKKPLKKYAQLEELLTDKDGTVAEWGTPYTKLSDPDDDESEEVAYCCGAPLEDVEDHEDHGKCRITGKFFKQNRQGALVECEDPTEA